MDFVCLHEKDEIECFLRNDVDLNIYSIGDLDDFFWPYTTWYGSTCAGKLSSLVLVYSGSEVPTVVGISKDTDEMSALLAAIGQLLPYRFYAHLSPGIKEPLEATYKLESHGEHWKMALMDETFILATDYPEVVCFSNDDLCAIQAMYAESYPGNWFDPRMLETGKYYGMLDRGKIISIAGIHVYSENYKVAALGNITTLPDYRNMGYGTKVTATLCKALVNEGMRVGLNVKTDNSPAIACYQRLGFQRVASYFELMVERKSR